MRRQKFVDAVEAGRRGDFNGDNFVVNQIFREYTMSAMTMKERIDKVMKKCSKKRKKLSEGEGDDNDSEQVQEEEKKEEPEEEKEAK